ncbi:MAG: hypothetical protein MAG471_01871 [Acidimicrobiaceae bacterium]|nr:hypothetical protein [Acidimicrobiaceae bacterium]
MRPRMVATAPITTASSRTDLLTWRPVAPSDLSRANSRTLWPRTIENVLLMMKALTTTAMMAKANRTFDSTVTIWSKSALSSSVVVAAVTTSIWASAKGASIACCSAGSACSSERSTSMVASSRCWMSAITSASSASLVSDTAIVS